MMLELAEEWALAVRPRERVDLVRLYFAASAFQAMIRNDRQSQSLLQRAVEVLDTCEVTDDTKQMRFDILCSMLMLKDDAKQRFELAEEALALRPHPDAKLLSRALWKVRLRDTPTTQHNTPFSEGSFLCAHSDTAMRCVDRCWSTDQRKGVVRGAQRLGRARQGGRGSAPISVWHR
jgi:hypothetical protein